MAHNLSWIDPDDLRSLVEATAYRPLEPQPSPASTPAGPPPSVRTSPAEVTAVEAAPVPVRTAPARPEPPRPEPPRRERAAEPPARPAIPEPPAVDLPPAEPSLPIPPPPEPPTAFSTVEHPPLRSPVGRRRTASVRRASRPVLPDPDQTDVAAPPPPPRAPAPAPAVPDTPDVPGGVEPFRPRPGSTLEARLEQLMTWAAAATGLSRVFMADADGLLVASLDARRTTAADAAAVVQMCTRAVPPEVASSERGTVSMSAGDRTHVVAWELTRHGKTYIALSGTVEPSPQALPLLPAAVRDALR